MMDFTPSPGAALPFEPQPWHWQMNPSTVEKARLIGSTFYYTGKPCKRGHLAMRKTADKICLHCRRDNIKDPSRKEFHARRASTARWIKANAEKINEKRREKNLRRRQLGIPPKNNIKTIRAWRERNPDQWRAIIKARSAHVKKATPKRSALGPVREFYRNRPDGHHVDHIIPLRHPLICGLHVIANLQYLPAAENIRKRNYFDIEAYNDELRSQSIGTDDCGAVADIGCSPCR